MVQIMDGGIRLDADERFRILADAGLMPFESIIQRRMLDHLGLESLDLFSLLDPGAALARRAAEGISYLEFAKAIGGTPGWQWTMPLWKSGCVIVQDGSGRTWEVKDLRARVPADIARLGCSGHSGGRLYWVGWDLDVGHGAESLASFDEAMKDAQALRAALGTAEIRRSAGGKGLHVRFMLPDALDLAAEAGPAIAKHVAQRLGVRADPANLGRQAFWLWARDRKPRAFEALAEQEEQEEPSDAVPAIILEALAPPEPKEIPATVPHTLPLPSTAPPHRDRDWVGKSTADDYNDRTCDGDVADLLTEAGWSMDSSSGANQYWTRPGKPGGVSASWNGQVLFVFSSEAKPFAPLKGYSAFGVYALLRHNGDHSAAAKALYSAGYGTRQERKGRTHATAPALVPTASAPVPAPDKSPSGLPLIVSVADQLGDATPEPIPDLWDGIVHVGDKLFVGGPSKARKSFLAMDFALAVSQGLAFLGKPTRRSRVLYLNLELRLASFQRRLEAIRNDIGVCVEDIQGWYDALHLRGRVEPAETLLPKVAAIAGQQYGLIIIDPVYKIFGHRCENDAGDMANFCGHLERLAEQTGATILATWHYAKGCAALKEAMDRISGSGVTARDPDAMMMMTPHSVEDCCAVEFVVRDHTPVGKCVLRWQYPRMRLAPALDPTSLKQPDSAKPGWVKPEHVVAILEREDREMSSDEIIAAIIEHHGCTQSKANAAWKAARRTLPEPRKQKRSGTNPLKLYRAPSPEHGREPIDACPANQGKDVEWFGPVVSDDAPPFVGPLEF